MWLTAAGWKTRRKYRRFKWSFAMTSSGLMYANQSMEQRRRFFGGLRNRKQSVTERKLSDSAHQDIKKSQSLCHRTRAQIACGICYKSFDLKSITSDIKGEKLGQFSVCRGSKLDISLFFLTREGLIFVSMTPPVISLLRSLWAFSVLQRTQGCRMPDFHNKRHRMMPESQGITPDQTSVSDGICQTLTYSQTQLDKLYALDRLIRGWQPPRWTNGGK